MNALQWLRDADLVIQACAAVLLAMSVASWVIIFWKWRLVACARTDVARCAEALWRAPALEVASVQVGNLDRYRLVLPLVQAARQAGERSAERGLGHQGGGASRATRLLRQALHASLARLRYGQVVLATVGATAPFVGLLGTVWGIQRALTQLAGQGQISVERLAGPVGEALVMTAAGLATAIPAVLAYNGFGRSVADVEADLEGLAHDLRALVPGAPAQE